MRRRRPPGRALLEGTGAAHELHFIDVPDVLCKARLAQRSRGLPPGTAWRTEAEFDAITRYFQPPAEDEGFVIVRRAPD